jgi:hypothetical protein
MLLRDTEYWILSHILRDTGNEINYWVQITWNTKGGKTKTENYWRTILTDTKRTAAASPFTAAVAATNNVLEDTDRILEDTNKYLEVLAITQVIVLIALSYKQKYLTVLIKNLNILTTT